VKDKRPLYLPLAVIAVVVGIYAVLGVMMNLEFAAATENVGYARAAFLWGLAALLSLAAAVTLGRAVWKWLRGMDTQR
jgi:hypothetical protein